MASSLCSMDMASLGDIPSEGAMASDDSIIAEGLIAGDISSEDDWEEQPASATAETTASEASETMRAFMGHESCAPDMTHTRGEILRNRDGWASSRERLRFTGVAEVQVVRAAGVVLVDDDGRVLLIRRGTEPFRGLWSVPGGSVQPGESLHEAAAREAREETGLDVSIGRELWSVRVPADKGRVFEIHDFAATVTGGSLRPGDDADDARWVGLRDLDDLPLTEGLAGFLRVAVAGHPAGAAACREPKQR